MNERIKELIAQAREPLHNRDLPFNQGLTEYSKKFAELIVRECVDIANKQFSVASGLDDRDSWTAVEIKKHFGVEK